jgi:hypothetical protein
MGVGGVCIILSLTFDQAHKKNGREVIKLETGENFEGRIIGVPLTFPNVDDNGKKIKGELDITLCSIYHPVDNIEFKNFNTILSSILMQLPPETNMILGHDINANVGSSANNGQHLKETIAAYGIENRNKKGISLINLMASLNMKITNSFFNPRPSNLNATTMHTTWRNPNALKSQHMLDVFSCLNTFFNRVQGCNPTRKGAESDHKALILKIDISKLAFKMKDKKLPPKQTGKKSSMMKQQTPSTTKTTKMTNANKNNNHTQEEYTNYFKNIKRVSKETAMKTITPPMDWFNTSKDKIQPQIDTVTSLLKHLRKCTNEHTTSRL